MRIKPSICESDAHMPAIWRILATLLSDSSVCQADLRARTGLSHPVVVQQIAQLRRSGLIQFGRPLGGVTGRPRVPITFNWEYRRLLAVEVHPEGLTFQPTDLSGRPVGEAQTRPLRTWTQAAIDGAIFDGIHDILQQPGAPWAGIGIVLPAAISADRKTIVSWTGIPDWRNDSLSDCLTDTFSLPVCLYNEAEALVRAVWAEGVEPTRSIMAISVRQNIRAMMAVMSANCVEYITDGPFGAVGHQPVAQKGDLCPECRTACLNRLLQATQIDPARRHTAIQHLATLACNMVTLFNPGCLVVQVDAQWTPEDTEIVQKQLRARTFPGAGEGMAIHFRPYRAEDSLLGVAVALAGQLLNLRTGQLSAWASMLPEASLVGAWQG